MSERKNKRRWRNLRKVLYLVLDEIKPMPNEDVAVAKMLVNTKSTTVRWALDFYYDKTHKFNYVTGEEWSLPHQEAVLLKLIGFWRESRKPKVQLKHIDTKIILHFLAQHQGRWSTWGVGYTMPTVSSVLPGIPNHMVRLKMGSLIRRGLSGGCECRCRGDYEITDKGLALIDVPRTKRYTGY